VNHLSFELSDEEGKFLVELARNAVKEYLKCQKHIQPPPDTPKKFLECCGVFVTINKVEHGEQQLRGCIGYPYPTAPLVEAIIDSAIQAATGDPRFPSMAAKELPNVVFEVSVLTPPELIETSNPKEYVSKFKVGEHGLIVERGPYKGLLLPQVPVEWNWCEEEFLCQCCMKAGLPPDTWLTKGTRIYRFKGIIFEETSPMGAVKRKALKEE
jgi:uncharacterized protein (TIGR00296 family)